MTEFFKAETKNGQVRLVHLVPDENPDNPLEWTDPTKDDRPLFILTNHCRYTLGDKDAEAVAWDLLQKEQAWDNDWFVEEFDILEQWNGMTEEWDEVEFRQRSGVGPDGAGRMCVEVQSKLDTERWVDVTGYVSDWRDDEVPGTEKLAFRWNTKLNLDYLEDDIRGLFQAAERCGAYVLPVYMYNHSGIALSTGNSKYPFNCQWDSGHLGFIMWTKKQVENCYGSSLVPSDASFVYKAMQTCFDDYATYVSGDVWGIKIYDPCGFPIDEMDEAELRDNLSLMDDVGECYGFFGYDYASNPETIENNFGLVKVEAL